MRNRLIYSALTLAVIVLGLASRKWPFFGKSPGDALWAITVFLLLAMARPTLSTLKLASYALLISYLDEFSQIYQAPWINAIRATTLGHLLLGSAFSWQDMLAYTIGVAVAALCRQATVKTHDQHRHHRSAESSDPEQ